MKTDTAHSATCPYCHGTGRVTDTTRRLYETSVTVTGYCACPAGARIRDAEIDARELSAARELAAQDWASDHMSPEARYDD